MTVTQKIKDYFKETRNQEIEINWVSKNAKGEHTIELFFLYAGDLDDPVALDVKGKISVIEQRAIDAIEEYYDERLGE